MAKQFSLNLVWVPQHSNIPGNKMSDELTRNETFLPHSPYWKSLGLLLFTCEINEVRKLFCKDAYLSWSSRDLIELKRKDITIVIGIFTRYILLGSTQRYSAYHLLSQ